MWRCKWERKGAGMKADIEIAQEAKLESIVDVAGKIGIEADDLELYGKYKAKIADEYI